MEFIYNDGGRKKAGFKGNADDCVVRSIAIASGIPYIDVYNAFKKLTCNDKKSGPRIGINKKYTKKYLSKLGWEWIPCMEVGKGCTVHLRENELQGGKLIVKCSKHLTAVIDGVINDTHDCSRNGTRCVYGYWIKNQLENGMGNIIRNIREGFILKKYITDFIASEYKNHLNSSDCLNSEALTVDIINAFQVHEDDEKKIVDIVVQENINLINMGIINRKI